MCVVCVCVCVCVYVCVYGLYASHVQGLLDTQLVGQPFSSSEFLSDYLRVFQASTDAAIVKMLQIKLLIPVSQWFVCDAMCIYVVMITSLHLMSSCTCQGI